MTAIMLGLAGLVVLIFGADLMIRGAIAVARGLGISPHVIGLTVIALGTSAPELVVSLKAAMIGSPGIAVGNVVGSNISNILLMIGTVGVICPFLTDGRSLRRDCGVLAGATVIFVLLGQNGVIEIWQGLLMLVLLASYLYYCYWSERRSRAGNGRAETGQIGRHSGQLGSWLRVVGGIVAVIGGAQMLVMGAVDIAAQLGVSETVIGITMVALGTSVPELATTASAAFRRHTDVALGNIIGSNIINTLGIVGVVASVGPLMVTPELVRVDLWVMAAITFVFIASALMLRTLVRPLAVAFFFTYVIFVTLQFYPAGSLLASVLP